MVLFEKISLKKFLMTFTHLKDYVEMWILIDDQ